MINVFTDGATIGWNGKLGKVSKCGLGIVIKYPNKDELYSVKVEGISNNEAEFKALIYALEKLIESEPKDKKIVFHLDSQIVVNRANGSRPKKAKFKNERMDYLQDVVIRLLGKLKGLDNRLEFKWIPREQNTFADQLSKDACRVEAPLLQDFYNTNQRDHKLFNINGEESLKEQVEGTQVNT